MHDPTMPPSAAVTGTHTSSAAHVTPAHGVLPRHHRWHASPPPHWPAHACRSRHAPCQQNFPAAHVLPRHASRGKQPATHLPSTHVWSFAHTTPWHLDTSSTHASAHV